MRESVHKLSPPPAIKIVLAPGNVLVCTGTKKFKKTWRLSRKKESNPGSLVQEPAVATTKPPTRPNGDGRLNHKCLYLENLNVLSLDSPGKKSTTIYFNLFFFSSSANDSSHEINNAMKPTQDMESLLCKHFTLVAEKIAIYATKNS